MDLEQLKQRRDELIRDNEWMDGLIKEKEDELWELKVRSIAASELARSAMQSAMRTAGIVDSFYGPSTQSSDNQTNKSVEADHNKSCFLC
ncbi:TPA: hypothetical protein VLK50_000596 [Streptococcus pyogenes]|uniref:Uncharacterized protein n=1 Tax=Streptococcus didelphis TaxID=102886 RepID=A0ABY9LIH1_9STRE|nr:MULTISPECIES: hypothetical protein [Streptococcus]HER6019572.1 hypothetical protein [Streptococcus pyogenes]WMB28652.1 hypothetical protein N1496_03935 [Streptococcus didelphis]HER6022292.1 hypothetical protein [Streptococcus pyogenes]HER6038416.1 hypothetical protein [Streptococcus pyogenes]HER6039652.1 hypothetical protein [Streptococcus pyogenes]